MRKIILPSGNNTLQKPNLLPYGKVLDVAEVGRLIRQRRKAAGKNQIDIANLAGVGPRFISELENGKETAEIGKVLQVLERLGLDIWIVPRGQVITRTTNE